MDDLLLHSQLSSIKLYKKSYTDRYIAGSSRCVTIHLSKESTAILSTVKDCILTYCDKIYSTSCVDQMLFLKSSKVLLVNLRSQSMQSNVEPLIPLFLELYTTILYWYQYINIYFAGWTFLILKISVLLISYLTTQLLKFKKVFFFNKYLSYPKELPVFFFRQVPRFK